MEAADKILILTPVKDAGQFLDGYFHSLSRLTYPRRLLSLGFLESDSRDDTFAELHHVLPSSRQRDINNKVQCLLLPAATF